MEKEKQYYSSRHEIGENIQKALNRKGWSQVKLAEEMDVHKTHVNKWVNNRVRPSSNYINLMAEKLDISPYEILTGNVIEPQKVGLGSLSKKLINDELESIERLLNDMISSDEEVEIEQMKRMVLSKVKMILNFD